MSTPPEPASLVGTFYDGHFEINVGKRLASRDPNMTDPLPRNKLT